MISRGTYAASLALALQGRCREAVAQAQRGLEVDRRSGESNQIPEVQLVGAVMGHAAAGHLAEAEEDALAGYEASLEANDQEGVATFCLMRGRVWIEQGRLSSASRAFLEGIAINRELNDTAALRWCLGGLALSEGMAGVVGPAASAVDELEELQANWVVLFEADLIDRGRAWAMVAAGEASAARTVLRAAAQRAGASQQWVAEAHLLHDLTRLGEPRTAVARLGELAQMIDGDLVALFADHAAAIVRPSGAALEAVGQRFEALGARLSAAEATTAAATLYRTEGRARQWSACARKVEDLLAACGEVHTPGLSQRLDAGRLTEREREVAGLAASGGSSKEIAERLFVSARTVENHLQSVYGKLGVSSREELAAVLGLP